MKNVILNYCSAGCLLFAAAALGSCSKKGNTPTPSDGGGTNPPPVAAVYNYASIADSMQAKTYSAYLSATGNYFVQNNTGNTTFNYWPNANMLDVLTDGYLRTKSATYTQRMKTLLTGIKTSNGGTYSNNFYDDMGWLGNASIRAYMVTNDADYLAAAQTIYTDIKIGVNNYAGGGVSWKKDQLTYKNIPSTANATILAARFYEVQNNASDLTLAKTLYSWMKTTLVDPSTGLVWDGINRTGDNSIDKNYIFTYNQGAFIGAAVELYNSTKDQTYLADAVLTANNLVSDTRLVSAGLLKDEGQGDGGLFKGIAVRYLTVLIEQPDLDAASRARYETFLQTNAQYLYQVGIAKPSYTVGSSWAQKPAGSVDLTTQLSGEMMMEAAAKLKTEGKIQ